MPQQFAFARETQSYTENRNLFSRLFSYQHRLVASHNGNGYTFNTGNNSFFISDNEFHTAIRKQLSGGRTGYAITQRDRQSDLPLAFAVVQMAFNSLRNQRTFEIVITQEGELDSFRATENGKVKCALCNLKNDDIALTLALARDAERTVNRKAQAARALFKGM